MHLNDTVRMSTRKVETPQEVLFRAGRYRAIADNSHVKKSCAREYTVRGRCNVPGTNTTGLRGRL